MKKKPQRRVRAEFQACICGAAEEPHVHLDDRSVVPWRAFVAAMERAAQTEE